MAAVEMGRDVGGRNQRQTLTAAEVEFIAEDVNVFIIPSFEGEEIHLIADSYGPFKVNRPGKRWVSFFLLLFCADGLPLTLAAFPGRGWRMCGRLGHMGGGVPL